MNAAHKILTVSYGTFSCTLEGFDDPFNTMKAIAEYFRDLAAEDRYFGAEPPQPDAAMLHKIAEREIHRRVEAKIQENGVVLRAQDAEAAPAVAAPVAAPVTAAAEPAPALLGETAAAQALATAAQRLQRLRAAQAGLKPAIAAPVVAPIAAAVAAPPAQIEEVAVEPPAPLPVPEVADPAPLAEVTSSEDVLASLRDTLSADLSDTAPLPEETPALEEDMPEARGETDLDETENLISMTLAAQAAEPAVESPVDTMAEPEADLVQDLVSEPELADDILAEPAMVEEVIAEPVMIEEEAAEPESLIVEEAFAEPEALVVEDAVVEAETQVFDEEIAEPEAVMVEEEIDLVEAEDSILQTQPLVEEVSEAPDLVEADGADGAHDMGEPMAEDSTAPVQPLPAPLVAEKILRARARVIKIRRIEQTLPAQSEESSLTEAAPPASVAGNTSNDHETAASIRAAIGDNAPRLAAAQTDDAAVNRLIEKANSELEEPQTKRRRSAIAHLKAAVLATVAERRANRAVNPDDSLRQDPYRKDLDQVMRPLTASAEKPADKPAPLVLLPTLRIDRPVAPAPQAAPIRPRRVTSAALAERPAFSPEEDELAAAEISNVFNEAPNQSFQEFADRLGAQSLQDMIEAAGAYLTLTKGQDAFTRPELFAQIGALGGDASREDGLRGFGRLLREGRLAKTQAGLYALTETSPMLAQAKRRAG